MSLKGGETVEGKLFGLGLTNIFGLFILFVVMIVAVKVALAKHPVKGVTEFVQTI